MTKIWSFQRYRTTFTLVEFDPLFLELSFNEENFMYISLNNQKTVKLLLNPVLQNPSGWTQDDQ